MFVLLRWISLIAMLEAPTRVACLNNVAMVCQSLEQKHSRLPERMFHLYLASCASVCIYSRSSSQFP